MQQALDEGGNLNAVDAEEDVVEEVQIETSPQAEEVSITQEVAIDEDAGMEIEDLENEITNVKQELAKDLKKPRLSKEQKADLRQEARELIREYKAEIADIKREAKKQSRGCNKK